MVKRLGKLSDPRLIAGIWIAMMGCAAAPAAPEVQEDLLSATVEEREAVTEALQTELARSMSELRIGDNEPPYFLQYHLRDDETYTIAGKYGALTSENHRRQRYAYVEGRVGSYEFDNFANVDSQSWRMADFRADRFLPLDGDKDALRGGLWLLTDEAYKKALSDYLTKRGGAVYSAESREMVPSFSQEEPQQYRGEVRPLQLDVEGWRAMVKDLTAEMRANEELLDSSMEINARRVVRYLVNSEGTDIIEEFTLYTIQAQAVTRAEDGMLLRNSRLFYALDADRLPERDHIEGEVRQMVEDLDALRQAPVIDPYTGPAILGAEAAGVLFHEAVGHRLEGERQLDEFEGRTFTGQVGVRMLPRFLSVYDDPGLREMEGTQLNGFYHFDDQGVPAQRASLVENGVLQGFLMSRTPIKGFDRSTGHGRAQGVNTPRARMSNLVVEADEEHSVPYEELKEMLIEETRRQDKPYGLIIRDITGGSTNTLNFGYQAFKGVPTMIYKVDAETGEETLVRGVEMVGTPLSSINKIEAASLEIGIFNGYCGAESGYVPVSAIAPALLTTEIELQRSSQARERRPVLSPPWAKAAPESADLDEEDDSSLE